MVTHLDDVWTSRDFPVLLEAARLIEAGASYVFEQPLAAATGLDRDQVIRAIVTLQRGGYVEARLNRGDDRVTSATIVDISPQGMREVGLWPSPETGAERLLAALDTLVEQAPNEAERSRWRKIRDGVAGAGRDVLISIAATVITGQLPGQ